MDSLAGLAATVAIEAVMENRGIDIELLRETLPNLLLSVTETTAG